MRISGSLTNFLSIVAQDGKDADYFTVTFMILHLNQIQYLQQNHIP
jgi:hypothetical protein